MKKSVKKIQKCVVCLSAVGLMSLSFSGVIAIPFSPSASVVHAESRYVIMTRTLSAQQTRDWAHSIRMAGGVNKASATVLGFIGQYFGYPALKAGASLAVFCQPAYLQTVLNAADNGRGLRFTITDSVSYHTSYSVQYDIRVI